MTCDILTGPRVRKLARYFEPQTPPIKKFANQSPTQPYVRDSTIAGAGKGLFAERDYETGEFVCYYDGILVPTADASLMDNSYMAHFRDGFEIDAATTMDSIGRYVNGTKPDQPKGNLKWVKNNTLKHTQLKAYEPIEKALYFVAKSPIKKGQEMFVNYMDRPGYWRTHEATVKRGHPLSNETIRKTLQYIKQHARSERHKADVQHKMSTLKKYMESSIVDAAYQKGLM